MIMMRLKKIYKSRAGFTLLETIVALVIVVIVSVAGIAAFTMMNNMSTKTKDLTDDIANLESAIASGIPADGDAMRVDNTLSFTIGNENYRIDINKQEYTLPNAKTLRKFRVFNSLPPIGLEIT
jgi:prepilin-type N-terminal cleavage/methylation domain-containing protein